MAEKVLLFVLFFLIISLFVLVTIVMIKTKKKDEAEQKTAIAFRVSKQGCLYRFDCYKDGEVYSIHTNYNISKVKSAEESSKGELLLKSYNGRQFKANLIKKSIAEKK